MCTSLAWLFKSIWNQNKEIWFDWVLKIIQQPVPISCWTICDSRNSLTISHCCQPHGSNMELEWNMHTWASKSFHIHDKAFKNSDFCMLSLSSIWSKKRGAHNLVSSRKKEEPMKSKVLCLNDSFSLRICHKSCTSSGGMFEKLAWDKYVRENIFYKPYLFSDWTCTNSFSKSLFKWSSSLSGS